MSSPTTGLMSRFTEASQSVLATRRPWGDLLDPTALSIPSSLSDATTRLAQNLTHFRFNYTLVLLLALFLSLIFHPISMIVFLLVFVAWLFLYFSRDYPLILLGFAIDDRVVVVGLGVVTVAALLLTGVWVNVVVSIAIGVALVCLHAVLRGTEDLVMEDRESPYGALLSDDPQGNYTII
ncbi:PRA1 family protein D [Ziziphus jujuba]|uniref:PRA1 family protein n=1 Tax=Ziziphus jujuba TaxID=326968 RepID=A0A6P6FZE2_ZIZJJ|nr:PRA1 family protein D [Ziziphus jujuba]